MTGGDFGTPQWARRVRALQRLQDHCYEEATTWVGEHGATAMETFLMVDEALRHEASRMEAVLAKVPACPGEFAERPPQR